ncbi:MAG TPA: type IV secretion system DNA-binding domain-containing protein [Pyrinomonadaceae bacterium]|nr:type IV secretion system DNA-binding domain-containing protein [Pyrinomonadaceae bacterium]HMP65581.1 type IV secretion system DNA-binding domain-containing protein [Pyrinomonadaceae bacterium]
MTEFSNNRISHFASDESTITFFARTDYRGELKIFGIKRPDRRAHMYLLGKTGTGKSSLMESMMLDDLQKGLGFALLDPHGDLLKKIRAEIPESRAEDVIDFDAADPNQPYGFNPLANIPVSKRPLACSGLIQVFKHLWSDSWGPRLEYILRNCLLSLLDYPDATLSDILRLLSDKYFREKVVSYMSNKQIRDFWHKEYDRYPERFKVEAISPIQNKVGAFLSHPLLKRILTDPERPLNLRRVMDEGKILLVNLAKGSIGEDTSNLLGSLLISRFDLAALSRANIPESQRRDYTLYLDEFHNFTTQSLIFMLSELRKYRLSLVLAHQYLTQLEPNIRDAILGNAGTIIVFRIGANDAETISMEFAPEFKITDFTNLPNYHIYLKLMIDGKISRPFSAVTIRPETLSETASDPV